ncbi:1,6-anhydro-N-acetylmuramyl-L-alanine amidase AmpD [Lonepinella koalarum]|uniref:1,6-anhydro-N-acetylmuramyl-L-alanine amidase AmpD n=1 Tax=Lonepinella koalarum TaxID=53417 RepID=UPI0011E3CB4B|nr:1,6-anhydro-N-acetylmuramyl-L-alanine amidase AmpD [Lonepinella koalarum]TYG34004.1 1,6-anhydro-N-acetylmuramyl-L-alanine amidase AmpD [Lonepinella koalarum]
MKNNKQGWLKNIRHLTSPHFDKRPDPQDVSLLVIHYISLPPEQFGGNFVDDFFLGKLNPTAHPYFKEIYQVRVSTHFFIDRNGRITQYVSLQDRAWHAGVSCFQGRNKCNDYSIGIELEGSNEQPFTEQQYAKLTQLTQQIMALYPQITTDRIVGHSDIAPERKIDPGRYFEWDNYLKSLG